MLCPGFTRLAKPMSTDRNTNLPQAPRSEVSGISPGHPLLLCLFQVAPSDLPAVKGRLHEALCMTKVMDTNTPVMWFYGVHTHELFCIAKTHRLGETASMPHCPGLKKHTVTSYFTWATESGTPSPFIEAGSGPESPPAMLLVQIKIQNHLLLQYGAAAERAVVRAIMSLLADDPNAFVLGGLGWNELAVGWRGADVSALLAKPALQTRGGAGIYALSMDVLREHLAAESVPFVEPWFADSSMPVFSRTYTIVGIADKVVEDREWDRLVGHAPLSRLEVRVRTGQMGRVAQAAREAFSAIAQPDAHSLRDELGEIDASLAITTRTAECSAADLFRAYFEGFLGIHDANRTAARAVYRSWLRLGADVRPTVGASPPSDDLKLQSMTLETPGVALRLLTEEPRFERRTAAASLQTIFRLYNTHVTNHNLYLYALMLRPGFSFLQEQLQVIATRLIAEAQAIKELQSGFRELAEREHVGVLRALERRLAQQADLTEDFFALYSSHSYGLVSEAPESLPGYSASGHRMLVALFGLGSAILQSGNLVPSEEKEYAYLTWLLEREPNPQLIEAPAGWSVARIPYWLLCAPWNCLLPVAHEAGHAVIRRSSKVNEFFEQLRQAIRGQTGREVKVSNKTADSASVSQESDILGELQDLKEIRSVHGLEQVFADTLALRTVFLGGLDAFLRALEQRTHDILGTVGSGIRLNMYIPVVARGFYAACAHTVADGSRDLSFDMLADDQVFTQLWSDYLAQLEAISTPQLDQLMFHARSTEIPIPRARRAHRPWWARSEFSVLVAQVLEKAVAWAPDWRQPQAAPIEAARRACVKLSEVAAVAGRKQTWATNTDAILDAYDAGLRLLGVEFSRVQGIRAHHTSKGEADQR